MGDPVSIAGLVLQIGVTIGHIYDYAKQIKEAKNDIRDLYAELLALKGILEQMKIEEDSLLSGSGNREMVPLFSSESVRDALNTTDSLLCNILDGLQKRQAPGRRSIKKLQWPLAKNELRAHIERLERLKSFFILVMMKDSSYVTARALHAYILNVPLRTLERGIESGIRYISDTLQEERKVKRRKNQRK